MSDQEFVDSQTSALYHYCDYLPLKLNDFLGRSRPKTIKYLIYISVLWKPAQLQLSLGISELPLTSVVLQRL